MNAPLTQQDCKALLNVIGELPMTSQLADISRKLVNMIDAGPVRVAVLLGGTRPVVAATGAEVQVMIVDVGAVEAMPAEAATADKLEDTLAYSTVEPDKKAMGDIQDLVVTKFRAKGLAI